VEQVHVVQGQLVHAGDVLAFTDQKEYKIALYQAMANLTYALDTAAISYFNIATTISDAYGGLNSAQAALKNAESQVAAAEHRSQADEAVLKQAQENAAEMDSAEAVVAADREDLLQAREKLVQAKADIRKAQTGPLHVSLANATAHAADALVSQRRAQLEQAELNLSYTIVRSPVTGIVGKRQIEVGQNVSVGQDLIDVVSLDDVWITANFKETQLVHLRPGEPVQIKVGAYGRTWKGHLTNVGGAAGSVFSAIPPRSTIGNPGRIAKRMPVRIDFDRPQSQDFNAEGLLKPGLSVEPEVRVRWLPQTGSSNSLPTS
jgi:membrane fusion protein (multidrug efflux system)